MKDDKLEKWLVVGAGIAITVMTIISLLSIFWPSGHEGWTKIIP